MKSKKHMETKQEQDKEESIDVSDNQIAAHKIVTIPEDWVPKTRLGKMVAEGKITSMDQVFEKGLKVSEPEIIDALVPDLEHEIIYIGGSSGKGGGIRRTISRRTTRMHKSGRRYKVSVMIVVGNKNGYIGFGKSSGPPSKHRDVINKALRNAKLNLIQIRRGCGSWECACKGHHSIPFGVSGKAGSVSVELFPAPKGIGLVVSDEAKKIFRLAGIKDVWIKSRGNTGMRINVVRAIFDAFKKLGGFKIDNTMIENTGLKTGKV